MQGPTTRRTFLANSAAAAVALAAAACRRPEAVPDPPPDAIARGIQYLLAQQSPDGAFRSTTYGFFAEGRSTTPFVALALAQAGADADAIQRAADACIALRSPEDGASGFGAQVPDYPVYATALTARFLARVRPDAAEPSRAWLRSQQFRAGVGWLGHTAAGGFGMGSRLPKTPPQAGHVDLSMTRRAIEALAGTDWDGADEAKGFVLRCRCLDGGFVYSPVQPSLNKGADGPQSSYGTATCDGILALLALGESADSEVVADAVGRLDALHRLDANPGLEGGPMEAFGPAMVGYYRAASAAVYSQIPGPAGWRAELTAAVEADQRADGSWANGSSLQKEDDPLIATAFALLALSAGS